MGATDDVVPALDDVQYRTEEGPCLAALDRQRVEYIRDVDREDAWAAFRSAARGAGVRSVLSVPTFLDGRAGALNFYGRRAGEFDGDVVQAASAFAAYAAVVAAVDEERLRAHQLEQAIETRAVIEQAKGIIIATSGVSADRAFDLLRQQSQHQNRKLRDIAAELVELHQRRGSS